MNQISDPTREDTPDQNTQNDKGIHQNQWVSTIINVLMVMLVLLTILLIILRVADINTAALPGLSWLSKIITAVHTDRIDNNLIFYIIVAALLPYIGRIESISLGNNKITMRAEIQRLKRQIAETSQAIVSANAFGIAKKPAVATGEEGMVRKTDLWESDPNKGQFGSSPTDKGRRLSAVVTPVGAGILYNVRLVVQATKGSPPLTGKVVFVLHPTFEQSKVEVEVKDGRATLTVVAYGAFTVGAECRENNAVTLLELDLQKLKSAPKDFRLK